MKDAARAAPSRSRGAAARAARRGRVRVLRGGCADASPSSTRRSARPKSQADRLGAQISAQAAQLAERAGAGLRGGRKRGPAHGLLSPAASSARRTCRRRSTGAGAGLRARARAAPSGPRARSSHRLVAIYEAGSADPTEMLLSSHGFDDLANRADLLGRDPAAPTTPSRCGFGARSMRWPRGWLP